MCRRHSTGLIGIQKGDTSQDTMGRKEQLGTERIMKMESKSETNRRISEKTSNLVKISFVW